MYSGPIRAFFPPIFLAVLCIILWDRLWLGNFKDPQFWEFQLCLKYAAHRATGGNAGKTVGSVSRDGNVSMKQMICFHCVLGDGRGDEDE